MLFLDTSKIDEIEKYMKMGIIRGVTTNPTIMRKDGVKDIMEHSAKIAELIKPYPLSVEVTSNDTEKMIGQAREYASLASNINVKIPIHGPNGEDYLSIINELLYDIDINVTAMMSVQQAYLAAMAGAHFVSLFGGRINNMGYDTVGEIQKLRKILDLQGLESKIIIGSVREALNVTEWLGAGAHIVTASPEIIKTMIIHPYTSETVQMFINDAKKLV